MEIEGYNTGVEGDRTHQLLRRVEAMAVLTHPTPLHVPILQAVE